MLPPGRGQDSPGYNGRRRVEGTRGSGNTDAREERRKLERRVENAKTLRGRVTQVRRELKRGKDWMYQEMRKRHGSL